MREIGHSKRIPFRAARAIALAMIMPLGGGLAATLSGCQRSTVVASPAHSATLHWKASTSKVTAYRIYRTTDPKTEPGLLAITPPDATEYVDTTVEGGRTYYYTVKSVGEDGTESVATERVTATIPKD